MFANSELREKARRKNSNSLETKDVDPRGASKLNMRFRISERSGSLLQLTMVLKSVKEKTWF